MLLSYKNLLKFVVKEECLSSKLEQKSVVDQLTIIVKEEYLSYVLQEVSQRRIS
jgi:hypothetical protein